MPVQNQHGLTATASYGSFPEAAGKLPYKKGSELPLALARQCAGGSDPFLNNFS